LAKKNFDNIKIHGIYVKKKYMLLLSGLLRLMRMKRSPDDKLSKAKTASNTCLNKIGSIWVAQHCCAFVPSLYPLDHPKSHFTSRQHFYGFFMSLALMRPF